MPGLYALRAVAATTSDHSRPSCSTSGHRRSSSRAPVPPPAPLPLTNLNNDFMQPPAADPRPLLSQEIIAVAAASHSDNISALHCCDHDLASPPVAYCSSGSPHDPSSVCLAAMVNEFLEEEVLVGSCGRIRCNCLDGSCHGEGCVSNETDDLSWQGEKLSEILEGISSCTSTPELLLLADVAKAIETETEELDAADNETGRFQMTCGLRRRVMKQLRKSGRNAAICKSRWSHGDGLPAGDYEYIDVVMEGKVKGKPDRFIIDIDFKSQFEIARASTHYAELLKVLPKIFVGRAERLKQMLKIMSNAAKRSLRDQGLHLPPWRKQRYMMAKWFSSYRRTTKPQDTETLVKTRESLGHIGMKSPGFCLEFTKEMDKLYFQEQEDRFVQERKADNHDPFLQGKITKCLDGADDDQMGNVFRSKEVLTRTIVAGFDADAVNNPLIPQAEEAFCTIMSTDWRLPPLIPREEQSKMKVSGLASALREAGVCFFDRSKESERAPVCIAVS